MKYLEPYLLTAGEWLLKYALLILLALFIIFIGLRLIRKVKKILDRWMDRKDLDVTVRPFLRSLVDVTLKIVLFMAALGTLGVKTASFLAVLGAMGLAIGLALQGSLSNFAGGVILLLLRPFKSGDFIEAEGTSGTVKEIQLFYTFLTTSTNQFVAVPNGKLANAVVKNYSRNELRGLEITFKVALDADVDKAMHLIEEVITSEKALLRDPKHDIYVKELGDNYASIYLFAWFKKGDYWPAYNGLRKKVLQKFAAAHITLPEPSMKINLLKPENNPQ